MQSGLEARDYLEVDLVARRWVATTDGVREAERPLESIGPLSVTVDVGNPSLEALAAEYFVHPNGRIDLSVLGSKTSTQAHAHAALEAPTRRGASRCGGDLGPDGPCALRPLPGLADERGDHQHEVTRAVFETAPYAAPSKRG